MRPQIFSKYTTWPLLCLGALTLGLFTIPTVFFGVIGLLGFFGWVYTNGLLLERTRFFKRIPLASVFGSIVVLLGTLIFHAIVYCVYKSTPFSIFGTFVFGQLLILLLYWYAPNAYVKKTKRHCSSLSFSLIDLLALAIVILQGLLFYRIIANSTTEVLASPWLLFGPRFFIAFGVSVFFLFLYFLFGKNNVIKSFLTFFHFVLLFFIAAIVYKLGYGYDPFLHRAAEDVVLERGFIDPKTPFYIGQYVFVNILVHLINFLPLKAIDIFLVPVLASFLLPFSTWAGLHYGLAVKKKWAYMASILVPLYPMVTMYVTTPNNLANVFLFITILLSPIVFRCKQFFLVLLITAFMAAVTHPLTGIFALWFIVGLFLFSLKGKKMQLFFIGYIFFAMLLTPLLFGLFLVLNGHPIPSMALLVENASSFLSLFKRPYYYANHPEASFVLDFIYTYQPLIPLLLFSSALYAFMQKRKQVFYLYIIFPFVLLVNAYVVSTWITLPGLASFEQIQYAERLRHISLFFIIPMSVYGMVLFLQKLYKRTSWTFFPVLIVLCMFLMTSFYLTYPQRNKKMGFPGFNVTQSDYDASAFMANHSEGTSFVVLSNILTAAAAIDREGFKTYYDTEAGKLFYYAIPSGSPLYTQFLNMVYEGQKREYMDAALSLTEVDRVYFVMHDYWKDFDSIVSDAKKTADGWQEINEGKVVVLWYDDPDIRPTE